MKSAFRGALCLLALCTLLAFNLAADTIWGTLNTDYIDLRDEANVNIDVFDSTGQIFNIDGQRAGIFLLRRIAGGTWPGDPVPKESDDFFAFCTELGEYINSPDPYLYNVVNLEDNNSSYPNLTTGQAGDISAVIGLAYGSAGMREGVFDVSVTQGQFAAAVQVAIWEIVYESASNTYQVGSGWAQFTNNTAVTGYAQALLDAINSGTNVTAAGQLFGLKGADPAKQDLVIQVIPPTNIEVPEPGTLALLGFGLLGLGILRRRMA